MDKETEQQLLDVVKKNYDEIADDFNQTRNKGLWPELVKFASVVRDGNSVLDVGCGNGRLIEAFAGKTIRYVGVDQSEKLVELAKQKYAAENIDFMTGNILDLDRVEQEEFDFLFCIAVIPHLPGRALRLKSLEQLKGRMKPDGRLIISAWNLWNKPKYVKFILKSAILKIFGKNKLDFGDILFNWNKDRSQRYYHAFTLRSLAHLCRLAGFKIRRAYKDKYNYYIELERP